MKHCIYCGLELPDDVAACNGCKQIAGPSQSSQDQKPPVTMESGSEPAKAAPAEKSEGILAKVLKFIGF